MDHSPRGIKKEDQSLLMPVKSSMVAAPPSRSIDVTMMLQTRAKQMKITCEVVPHRILMTSR